MKRYSKVCEQVRKEVGLSCSSLFESRSQKKIQIHFKICVEDILRITFLKINVAVSPFLAKSELTTGSQPILYISSNILNTLTLTHFNNGTNSYIILTYQKMILPKKIHAACSPLSLTAQTHYHTMHTHINTHIHAHI